jgi:hypothetical protein
VVWKRTGVNPIVFKGSDDAHDFIGRIFKLLFALIVGVVLVLVQPVYLLDAYRMARILLVEIDGHCVVALIARLDSDCSSADGRILAYRYRSIASHKLSAERGLQPFPKSDLPWDVAYAVRALSCDPKCFDAAYPWARCRADSDSSAARRGIPCQNTW